MSSLAIDGSEAPVARGRPPVALRYADFGLLGLALLVFLAAGVPVAGWIAAAVAWCAQHAVLVVTERRATGALRRGDRRSALGAMGFATMGRLWIVTIPILLAGLLVEREAGLAAAVIAAALVTAQLLSVAAIRLFFGEDEGG